MAVDDTEIEILTIIGLMVASFISAHLLRKYNIIYLPESLVAVVLSMLVAVAWYFAPFLPSNMRFNNETFFMVLLPFIIFESGFSVHRQSLFRNMGSILAFAIIGTFLAAFGIGLFLWGAVKARGGSYDFSLLECMIIGAIMSSTDPVATLSIFSKLNMDRMTYSLVFGESMLNDAVSIVSFQTLASFYTHAFNAATFFKAVGMFLLIFTGATLIGLLFAVLVSLILRRTDIGKNHTPLEVVFLVGGAYLAYFVSDVAQLSGIVSIFFYGIASRHYTYYTLSEKSQKGCHWIFEAVKEVAEMLVFVLLGVTILQDNLKYDFFLISMTCLGLLIARALATVILSFILNIRRPESDRISLKSQLVLWNAGLRGAVAYALSVSSQMPKTNMVHTNLMITTVHAAVIFTILFHGLLTFPVVWWTGLSGANAARQLSEPRPARKKLHGLWSRLDKNYIIPLISYPRVGPEQHEEVHQAGDVGLQDISGSDNEHSSMEIERGPVSYDGFDQNPQNLDISLFQKDSPAPQGNGHANSALDDSSDPSMEPDSDLENGDHRPSSRPSTPILSLDAGHAAQSRNRANAAEQDSDEVAILVPPPADTGSAELL